MGEYAKRTKVPVSQSKAEIEKIVKRYDAHGFLQGEIDGRVVIGFMMADRQVRFLLNTKGLDAQEERQRWRALVLTIKSKLESVASGIETFEDAFLAQIVLPNGQLAGDWMRPQIENAYQSGDMPPLLPGPKNE